MIKNVVFLLLDVRSGKAEKDVQCWTSAGDNISINIGQLKINKLKEGNFFYLCLMTHNS